MSAERVLVLGDAAGYVEPFTGEGIAWALASAVAVAPLADRAVSRWDDSLGREWGARHRQIVTGRQRMCRLVARILRHPRLAHCAIQLLGWWPRLAAPFVHRLNAVDAHAKGILS